jgi:uncharacterized Zn-finger protein
MIPTSYYPINLVIIPHQIPFFSPPSKKDESQISFENEANKKMFLQKKTGRKYKNLVECYKCNIEDCSKLFETEEELNNHKKIHTKIYICNYLNCGMRFENEINLQKHIKAHLPSKKIYKCNYPGCDKSFTASYNLKIHYRIHSGERPYHCEICGTSYYDRANYKYHIRTAHVIKNNKDTICSHLGCKHTFKTKKQKIMHHDKLEDECRSDKNYLMSLIASFKSSLNDILNEYSKEEINKICEKFNISIHKQTKKVEEVVLDKEQYDALLGIENKELNQIKE